MTVATPHAIRNRPEALVGSSGDLMLGKWSAHAIAAFSIPYAITMVLGFTSMGNLRDPLPDPYLAVAEVLILLMAPFMVTLMIAVHACAPVRLRALSLTALGWMLMLAGLTMTVHFVELTFVRRINPAEVPGFDRLLGLVGPAFNVLAWRGIGIFGYAVVFPVTCLALSRAFTSTARVRPVLFEAPDGTSGSLSRSRDLARLLP